LLGQITAYIYAIENNPKEEKTLMIGIKMNELLA
jgi:hypothetical protein